MELSTRNNYHTVNIYAKDALKVVCRNQGDHYIGEVSFGTLILENQEFPTLYIPDLFVSSDGGFVICRGINVDSFTKDGTTFTRVNQFPENILE